MGLNVYENRSVAFDDTHQKRVDTSILANPTVSNFRGIVITHVYRRNRTGDLDRDGNPLIHALKGLNGYSIVPMYRAMFMARAREIITTFIGNFNADAVVPVPSGSSFCAEFAALVGETTQLPVLPSDFVAKRSIAEMLAIYDGKVPPDLGGRRAKLFKAQLGSWRAQPPNRTVSMKDIDTHIRPYFDPLVISKSADHLNGSRIVIVDDLMSSGASIAAMADKLAGVGAGVSGAVTFLSSL